MTRKDVHVLGTVWKLEILDPGEDEKLERCDGYTDWTKCVMRVLNPKTDKNSVEDLNKFRNKVIRHEIIHAFLFESGLAECSADCAEWAKNEEMVDWFAHQGPKIYAVWKEADAL